MGSNDRQPKIRTIFSTFHSDRKSRPPDTHTTLTWTGRTQSVLEMTTTHSPYHLTRVTRTLFTHRNIHFYTRLASIHPNTSHRSGSIEIDTRRSSHTQDENHTFDHTNGHTEGHQRRNTPLPSILDVQRSHGHRTTTEHTPQPTHNLTHPETQTQDHHLGTETDKYTHHRHNTHSTHGHTSRNTSIYILNHLTALTGTSIHYSHFSHSHHPHLFKLIYIIYIFNKYM